MPTETPTHTEWKRRITTYCEANGVEKSASAVQRLATKIHKIAQKMWDVDPDDLLRSVLDYSDPTGETAVANVMDPRPVAPTYRPTDVTGWSHEAVEDMHHQGELTQDLYAANLAAWEERHASRNAA